MKTRSNRLVLTSSPQVMAAVGGRSAQWKPLAPPGNQQLWTDDFANVLWAMRF
jgi:hypothetical protein